MFNLLAADGSIRIALAGDWGTGADVAQQVADSMVSTNPELTIHLGDIYYVGTDKEVQENCLDVHGSYQGVLWKHGTKGSFALNGNHKMYSGGNPYVNDFLPTLGIPTSQDKQELRSYFCLEAPAWRILAIDTGYNSDCQRGLRIRKASARLAQNVVDPIKNRKPTVLLSHHHPDLSPKRFSRLSNETLVGTNGYAMLTIQGSSLSLEYLDADKTSLLKETFRPGGEAAWDGTLVRAVVSDPHILNQMTSE